MKKIIYLLIALILVLGIFSGCQSEKQSEATVENNKEEVEEVKEVPEMYVSAAASLTESMKEVADLYEEQVGDAKVILNFASSGSLQRQIEQGAPTDVFVSASLGKMKTLDEEDLLEDGYNNLLKNEIVLVVPKENSIIENFDNLKEDKEFIFAIGEPESVPAGKYASEVLNYLELTDLLSEKTVMAKDVKEVLTWVEMGEADAGMVYATDAYVSKQVDIAEWAPDGSHSPIIYPCAVVKDSKVKKSAEGFIEFLQSEEAIKIFENYGFKKAE